MIKVTAYNTGLVQCFLSGDRQVTAENKHCTKPGTLYAILHIPKPLTTQANV